MDCFSGCESLESAKYLSGVTEVREKEFYNCTNLKTIEFADTIQSVRRYAFYGTGIEILELPNSLEEIGDYAFDHGVDIVCGYGPLSLKMIEHCKDKKGYWFETKEEMGKFLRPYLQQDCAILVKGSRSMGMDVLVDILKGELK